MKITLEQPTITSQWVVEAFGHSTESSADNRETIYQGNDEKLAKRAYLEVLALKNAFPEGRGHDEEEYSYHALIAPLFKGMTHAERKDRRFGWASHGWSQDDAFEETREASLDGAKVYWIDEHGAYLSTTIELEPEDQALIDHAPVKAFAEPYDLGALIALFDQWELRASTAPASPGRSAKTL